MPEISTREEFLSHQYWSVVRMGDKFFIGDRGEDAHTKIAKESGVTRFGAKGEPIVDDGGFIGANGAKLMLFDATYSCLINGDPEIARKRSEDVLASMVGEENIERTR